MAKKHGACCTPSMHASHRIAWNTHLHGAARDDQRWPPALAARTTGQPPWGMCAFASTDALPPPPPPAVPHQPGMRARTGLRLRPSIARRAPPLTHAHTPPLQPRRMPHAPPPPPAPAPCTTGITLLPWLGFLWRQGRHVQWRRYWHRVRRGWKGAARTHTPICRTCRRASTIRGRAGRVGWGGGGAAWGSQGRSGRGVRAAARRALVAAVT